MKEVRDWKEQDVLNLPPGEFDWFEAKGRRGLDLTLASVDEHKVREILSTAVSAFANSGGGTLCFGLTTVGNHWQIDDGGVSRTVKRPSTRGWLEDIIPRIVEPELIRFNVYEITAHGKKSKIDTGRAVFLIEIPDSEQAPHQALDKRYYGRIGGKSKPLGHRFVADIFGRRRDPQFDLDFQINAAYLEERRLDLPSTPLRPVRKVELKIRAKNVGRVYAEYVNCFVAVPTEFAHEDAGKYMSMQELPEAVGSHFSYVEDNTHRDLIKVDFMEPGQYGPSRFNPILPGLTHIWTIELRSTLSAEQLKQSDKAFYWRIFADNALARTGSIPASEIEYFEK